MDVLGFAYLAAGIGAALVVLGAGLGISRIGSTALETMGRQPEISGQLRTSMIIAAALIEGVAFFAAAICLLLVLK